MREQTIQTLKKWFLANRRSLPWRDEASPYAVWVSEVMLQQTQVAVVIPYFERWMERFPSIKALAEAEEHEVIKLWEGLGYYSRARNLHAGARYVLSEHTGELPDNHEALSKIKGLGDYTVGAILTFAFRKKAPAVDGNVIRVLTRFYGIGEDIAKQKTVKKIREMTAELLPDAEPWLISEGLIELGATVCQKRPKCASCPLKGDCKALKEGTTQQLPYKSAKTTIEQLHRNVAVITCKGHILVRQAPPGEIMAGLHEFPYFDAQESQDLPKTLKKHFGIDSRPLEALEPVSHSFTRFRVKLYPSILESLERQEIPGYSWVPLANLGDLPFSSGHRRILESIVIFFSPLRSVRSVRGLVEHDK